MKNLYILCLYFFVVSCQSAFLDVKPSVQSIVPITLDDFESLLRDAGTFQSLTPVATNLAGSDEYEVPDGTYNSHSTELMWVWGKYAYTWDRNIYTGDELYTDWSSGYKRILQANVVLDGLVNISPDGIQKDQWKRVKGMALFHRAFAYYCLAQTYCPVYKDVESAKVDLGLPLRKKANPTLKIERSNLADTYSLIIEDLLSVVELLPKNSIQQTKMDPTAEAAHALLTRVYMQMGSYEIAEKHAKICLENNNQLLNYSLLDKKLPMPFPSLGKNNPEVLFYNVITTSNFTKAGSMNVATEFIDLYEEADLRKEMFFVELKGAKVFSGGYTGVAYTYFGGLAIDEVYLNLAECLVRRDAVEEALSCLNELRKNRFLPEDFTPYVGLDKEETLFKVLEERKRQLYFRGLRWEDMRRLNKEPKLQENITRLINGETYTLEPGSVYWTWPIPPTALLNGGYDQNPR